MFTEIEQEALDIDWFFTNNEYVGFCASGGGLLPPSVVKSKENNELLRSYFNDLPERSETIINPLLDKTIENPDERYLFSFIEMAKKGIFAFDRTMLENHLDPNYHLVATPVNPIRIQELPSEILKVLSDTVYGDNMEAGINISFFR